MKKIYDAPKALNVAFESEDVITFSQVESGDGIVTDWGSSDWNSL